MLKITPYLGILVLIVSIGGLWYPAFGYFMLLILPRSSLAVLSEVAGSAEISVPEGSFVDFWVDKISRKKKIPDTLRSLWVRLPISFSC